MTSKQFDYLYKLSGINFDYMSEDVCIDYRLKDEVKKLPVELAGMLIKLYIKIRESDDLNYSIEVAKIAYDRNSFYISAYTISELEEELKELEKEIDNMRKDISKLLKMYPNVMHENYIVRNGK